MRSTRRADSGPRRARSPRASCATRSPRRDAMADGVPCAVLPRVRSGLARASTSTTRSTLSGTASEPSESFTRGLGRVAGFARDDGLCALARRFQDSLAISRHLRRARNSATRPAPDRREAGLAHLLASLAAPRSSASTAEIASISVRRPTATAGGGSLSSIVAELAATAGETLGGNSRAAMGRPPIRAASSTGGPYTAIARSRASSASSSGRVRVASNQKRSTALSSASSAPDNVAIASSGPTARHKPRSSISRARYSWSLREASRSLAAPTPGGHAPRRSSATSTASSSTSASLPRSQARAAGTGTGKRPARSASRKRSGSFASSTKRGSPLGMPEPPASLIEGGESVELDASRALSLAWLAPPEGRAASCPKTCCAHRPATSQKTPTMAQFWVPAAESDALTMLVSTYRIGMVPLQSSGGCNKES